MMSKHFLVFVSSLLLFSSLFAQEKIAKPNASEKHKEAQALNAKGYNNLLNERYNDAIELFKQAIEISPSDPILYQNIAYCYSQLNSLEKARESYLKALSLSPEDPSLHNLCGQIEYKLKNDSIAVSHFSNAIKKVYPNNYNQSHAKYFMHRGNALLRSEKYIEAISDYTKASQLDQRYYGYYHKRATAFLKNGNKKSACKDWDYIRKHDSNNAVANRLYKEHCGIKKNTLGLSEETQKPSPSNFTYATFKGGNLGLQKFLLENITYPTLARERKIQGYVFLSFNINADGNVSDIRVLKGIGHGCDQEAIRAVQKSSGKWIPSTKNGKPVKETFNLPVRFIIEKGYTFRVEKIHDLGAKYLLDGKYNEAISCFTKSINTNQKIKSAYFNRGICYFQLKKYNKALDDFLSSKANGKKIINSNIADAYFNLGVSQYENQQYDSAIHYYSKAIEYNATNRNTYFNLAASYFNVKDIENACCNWQEAANLGMEEADKQQQLHCSNQKLSAYFYKKASILESNSNFEDAIEYYSMVIDLFPNVSGTYLKRANCFRSINQKNKACSDYKKAADLGNEGATKLKGDYCQ